MTASDTPDDSLGGSVTVERGMAVIRVPLPSADELRLLLRYEPESGRLFWIHRDRSLFSTNRAWRLWNARYEGAEAFATFDVRYMVGRINGIRYYAHRVIWRMVTGEVPDQIDHINGNRLDNRFVNLRNVSAEKNSQNLPLTNRNRSGQIGVSWSAREGAWRAEICARGVRRHLGYFQDLADAIAARKEAQAEMGFHPNHGRSE